MATILLVGSDAALLEGLAQLLAVHGHAATVARTLAEGREWARRSPPLVAVLDRKLIAGGEAPGMALEAGGALVLYRASGVSTALLPADVLRGVLADLTLPLERHRLVTLVDRVAHRAAAVGRGSQRDTPPETPALR